MWSRTQLHSFTQQFILLDEATVSLFNPLINSNRSNPGAAFTVITAHIDKVVDQCLQPIQAQVNIIKWLKIMNVGLYPSLCKSVEVTKYS